MIERFYPVLPDIDWLERLVPMGVRLVQLRLKDVPESEVRRQISRAIKLCEQYGAQLVVNDYWREAIGLGADFVHLGQEDLGAADVPAIRQAGIRLGVSTHDRQELARALAVAPDYVAIGPVYETTLKAMTWAPQGLECVSAWKKAVPCPLVAIGGITVERAPDVLAAGADSIAVVTDVITHPDPEARTREWLVGLG